MLEVIFGSIACFSIFFIVFGIGFYFYKKDNKNKNKDKNKNNLKEKIEYNEDIINLYTYLINNSSKFITYMEPRFTTEKVYYLTVIDSDNNITYEIYLGKPSNLDTIDLDNCCSHLKVLEENIDISNINISNDLRKKFYDAFLYPLTNEYKLKALNTKLLLGINNNDQIYF